MYQSLTVIGRLGRDPESRFMPNGDRVTSFNIATDRSYTKGSERVKETTWFRVTIFGKQAEACDQFLSKGKMVLVEGRLGVDPATGGPKLYTNKDGKTSTSFELIADIVRFLSPPSEDGAKHSAQTASVNKDDIPF